VDSGFFAFTYTKEQVLTGGFFKKYWQYAIFTASAKALPLHLVLYQAL